MISVMMLTIRPVSEKVREEEKKLAEENKQRKPRKSKAYCGRSQKAGTGSTAIGPTGSPKIRTRKTEERKARPGAQRQREGRRKDLKRNASVRKQKNKTGRRCTKKPKGGSVR